MSSASSEKESLFKVLPIKVADARSSYPELGALAERYTQETVLPELGSAEVNWDRYTMLENAGMGKGFVLDRKGCLLGFLFLLIAPVPHQAAPVATIESIYAERGGSLLIAAAKQAAREAGCRVLVITAPVNGRLSKRMKLDRSARHSAEAYVWAL